MTLIVYIHFYLMDNSSCTIVCPIDIPDHYWSFQFLQPKSMFCCYLSIYKHPCSPLFKSAFTVMPLCISIFSTPMSSYTSLNILNVLLTFFYLSPSLTVPFRVSVHVPLYCAFPSVGYTTSLQFYYSFFFSTLYSGHKILLFYHSDIFFTIVSLFLHFIHSTLIIFSLFASSSLQFYTSWYRLHYMFLTCFLRRNPCP